MTATHSSQCPSPNSAGSKRMRRSGSLRHAERRAAGSSINPPRDHQA